MKYLTIQPLNKNVMEKLPYPYIVNLDTGEVLHQNIHKGMPEKFIGFKLPFEPEIKIDLASASILTDEFLSTIPKAYRPVFKFKDSRIAEAQFDHGYTLSIQEV